MALKIALGTVQFGQTYGISNTRGQVDARSVAAILDFARDAGIDTLDTAVVYGTAEQRLGELGVEGFRVITKVPALGAVETLPPRWLADQIEASLERLRLDRVYGLILHRPADLGGPCGPALAQQLKAVKASGLALKTGASIYGPDDLEFIASAIPLDLVQAPTNVFDRRLARSGWLDRLSASGVEVHVRSMFLQGLLLMPADEVPARFDPWRERLARWRAWLVEERLTPVEGCIAHALGLPQVERFVVGCENLEQLREIVQAFGGVARCAPSSLETDDERLIDPATWSAP
jgi:aryl-alcohol dehydrogenase-like predicted oxidoreductase